MTKTKSDRRLLALDAARGFAMVGVCLAHFGIGIVNRDPAMSDILRPLGMFASPTFIVLSGALLGYLVATAGAGRRRLQLRLVDRGLFLLTVAHVIIGVAHYQRVHSWIDAATLTFMTDTIGVSLIVGALAPRVANRRRRLVFAGALYAISWIVVLAWTPSSAALGVVKETLFGATDRNALIQQNFPILPWFAVYLAATTLGEALAVHVREGSMAALGRRMMAMGPAAILAGFLIKVAYWLVHPTPGIDVDSMSPFWRDVWELTTPFDKYPPGPTYLLAYGGLAFVLVGWTMLASERGWLPRLLAAAAVVGRASLMVFMVQFFIYYLVVPILPLPNRLVMVPYLAVSVAVLWVVAWAWDRNGGNRFITVGLPGVIERFRRAEMRGAS